MKLVVDRASQRVVGAHMIGARRRRDHPGHRHRGEARRHQGASSTPTIGIHPTVAEEFVTHAREGVLKGPDPLFWVRFLLAASSCDAINPSGRQAPSCRSSARCTENVHVDVCIVGAGISGLTTAYLLARAGKRVAVLDDGPVAGGMTQMTTAHITNKLDDRYFEAREAARARGGAARRREPHRGDRPHRDHRPAGGHRLRLHAARRLPLSRRGRHARDARARARGRASRRPVGVELVERAPFASFDTGPCLRFPNQAQFHPLKYLARLAQAIVHEGGRIFTGSHADRIEGGVPALVHAGRHVVTADAVVVATNAPVNDRVAIHTKQAPYMTYVIGARMPRGSVPRVLAWDTGDPYHYIRAGDAATCSSSAARTTRPARRRHARSAMGGWKPGRARAFRRWAKSSSRGAAR